MLTANSASRLLTQLPTLPEPIRIRYIIIGDPADLTADHFLRDILDLFSWHTCINASRFTHRIFQYYGSRSNDRVAVHDGIIHHNSAHPDQYIVVHRTAVYDSIVTDGNIIANRCAAFLKRTMNAGAVLNVDFIPHPDKIHIAPHHSIEPDAAIIAHNHIPHDGGIRRQEAIGSKLRMFALYGKYYQG